MTDTRKLSHSQNFIKRRQLVDELLKSTSISKDDTVIEIGPGKGIITSQLLQWAGKVIAIEKDLRLVNQLRDALHNSTNLELIVTDFLSWRLPKDRYKVFSNIPFNLTSDIVNKLTEADTPPVDAYLIMQKAAAERFAGMPYSAESLISILLKVEYEVTVLRAIHETEFVPRPNVDIVFVQFHMREMPLIPENDMSSFRDFVVYCYTLWVPTIRDALKNIFTAKQLSRISRELPLSMKPTEISFQQWMSLFSTFQQYANRDGRKTVAGSNQRLQEQQKSLNKQHRTRRRR